MCVTYTLHELCASSITLPKCLLNVDVETKMPHIYEHWSNSTSTDSIEHTIQFSLMIEKLKIRTESIYRTVYPTLSSIQAPSNKIHFYRIRMKEIMDAWKMVEREREKKTEVNAHVHVINPSVFSSAHPMDTEYCISKKTSNNKKTWLFRPNYFHENLLFDRYRWDVLVTNESMKSIYVCLRFDTNVQVKFPIFFF